MQQRSVNERILTRYISLHAEVSVSNHTILAQFCKDHHVGLVVVGPEVPLAAGEEAPPPFYIT